MAKLITPLAPYAEVITSSVNTLIVSTPHAVYCLKRRFGLLFRSLSNHRFLSNIWFPASQRCSRGIPCFITTDPPGLSFYHQVWFLYSILFPSINSESKFSNVSTSSIKYVNLTGASVKFPQSGNFLSWVWAIIIIPGSAFLRSFLLNSGSVAITVIV